MKYSNQNYKWLFLFLCCFFACGMYSQVTLGLDEAPAQGTILQIKNIANQDTGANANKGLGMPRMFLPDSEKLSPMYSYADASNTPTQAALTSHTGLVVYNLNTCLNRKGDDNGLYVWQGGIWNLLSEKAPNIGVGIFIDPRDKEEYKVGNFGTAGVWMLENMRATTYSQSPADPPVLSNTISKTSKNYIFPASPLHSPGSTGTDIETYAHDKSIGLLYNWAAATNKENDVTANQGGDFPSHPVTQGICPPGWHLPSDKEWTDLENYIIANTSNHSTSPNIGGTPLDYTSTGWRGTHGTAMKAPCQPVGTSTATSSGTSFSVANGGFYAYMVGYHVGGNTALSGYGVLSYFWSGSSAGTTGNQAWTREVASSHTEVWRNAFQRTDFYPVRCKQDAP